MQAYEMESRHKLKESPDTLEEDDVKDTGEASHRVGKKRDLKGLKLEKDHVTEESSIYVHAEDFQYNPAGNRNA